MMMLITGGSKSGKSRLAETVVTAAPPPHIYLATMMPFGQEAEEAIARHRRMREGKGFVTLEQFTDIGTAAIPAGSAVLLECMGNLCANEMFDACSPDPAGKILDGIQTLAKKTSLLVIVTNDVGRDGIVYPPETMRYIRTLTEINAALSWHADCVMESVCGIPLVPKGEKPSCLC